VLIAALGDSITAGTPLWDPNPAIRAQMPEQLNDQSQYEYWARRRLGPQVRFRNCGVAGETTAQIARRLPTCARGAQALIVQGGINDIARGMSVESAAAHLRGMVRAGRRLGLRVALAEVLPWNNGYPRYAALIVRLNARIRDIARSERVRALPFFAALEDPDRPGRMREDWTIEGDHPSVIGYRRLGAVVVVP
jgi:lysophospholipase L1-like esterase